MDYEKMLFAFYVRQEAIQTLQQQTQGMEPVQIEEFITNHRASTVANIVQEVEAYASLVKDAYELRSAADAKSYWEELGKE